MTSDDVLQDWMNRLDWFTSTDHDSVLAQLIQDEESQIDVLPPVDNMLNAYSYVPWHEVRVVIIGQAPYPVVGYDHGLAFSVQPDVSPLPQTLQDIYTELELDYGSTPETGCLDGWAQQGVMLLNTSLSVQAGEPHSHKIIGWNSLIDETIRYISKESLGVVFILLGDEAIGWSTRINTRHHLVLSSGRCGFFGSRPFTKTNRFLVECGFDPIEWDRTAHSVAN